MRLIDADALLKKQTTIRVTYHCQGADEWDDYEAVLVKDINNAPTISPDDVRGVGKWKMWEDYYGSNVYQCAVCGADWDMIDGTPEDNDMNYCPSCGAKMEGTSDGI